MGTIVAFHASYELQHEHPGLVHGVVYSGCALVPGPSAASPFGVRCLFCLTQVRGTGCAGCLPQVGLRWLLAQVEGRARSLPALPACGGGGGCPLMHTI